MTSQEKEAMKYIWGLATSLKIGEKLPSEGQISIKFKIPRMVSRNILKQLETLGVIASIPKKGYFVMDNLNHSRTFNKFNKKIINIHESEIPKFIFDIINSNYPLIEWMKEKNRKNLIGFVKEYHDLGGKLINSTFLVINKQSAKNKFSIMELKKSIITTLKNKENCENALNTILGIGSKMFKISIFINDLGLIIAVTITEIFPKYLYERFLKKII